jgi:hypothetical protein
MIYYTWGRTIFIILIPQPIKMGYSLKLRQTVISSRASFDTLTTPSRYALHSMPVFKARRAMHRVYRGVPEGCIEASKMENA